MHKIFELQHLSLDLSDRDLFRIHLFFWVSSQITKMLHPIILFVSVVTDLSPPVLSGLRGQLVRSVRLYSRTGVSTAPAGDVVDPGPSS